MFVDTSIKSRFQKASTIIPKDSKIDSEVKVCVDIAKQGLRCPDYKEPEILYVEQALVSKPYPYFLYDGDVVASIPSFVTFDLKSQQKLFDELVSEIPQVVSFALVEPLIKEGVFDEVVTEIPSFIGFNLISPLVKESFKEGLGASIPSMVSFVLDTVAIRVDFEPDGILSSIPTFISFELE